MRSGNPCPARERRASSAPACRIAARSWSLSGCRAVSPGVPVPSARPAAGLRASRADARAGPGTGPPPGRSLTRTAPGPAHTAASPADPDRAARARVPPVPVTPGARPPGHAHRSGDVRPVTGGLAERQPWRGAGCPARTRFPANRQPATGRGRMRPVRPVDDAAGGLIGPGPVMGIVRGSSGAGLAGQQAGGCPVRPAGPGPALLAAVSRVTARPPGRPAGRAGAQQNAVPGRAPAARTRCRGRPRCGRPARRRAAGRRPGSPGRRWPGGCAGPRSPRAGCGRTARPRGRGPPARRHGPRGRTSRRSRWSRPGRG